MKRLMLAAPMSGSGKTTIAAGLIAALAARRLRVAPFKVGPDYIDPSYHTLAAGLPAHNLDAWLLPPERISASFARRTQDADVAIIEGMMGLFDGFSGTDDTGSAAHIAHLLGAPVILILDASAMARSAAAIVRGFRDFDPQVRIAGVILNRVGGAGHAQMVQTAIESATGVPVVGYLTQDAALHLPERHLGLIPTAEPGRWQAWSELVRDRVAQTVQLDRLLAIADSAGPMPTAQTADPFAQHTASPRAKLAIAHDEAFNFVYADNLDLLQAAGAELVEFSPLHDATLPVGAQGIYLCGGFPELYAAQLAANQSLLADLRKAGTQGLPIYAECGGLMLLTEAIVDGNGAVHRMAGLLPGRSVMTPRLTIGYRTAQALQTNWLSQAGETIRGHEFHHSVWQDRLADLPFAYILQADAYHHEEQEGACLGNVVASYLHLHFLAQPILAERFVRAAENFSRINQ
ncbi:MAG: cobyrinate a,c-diamide synthase [Caldilineaceae bacterium]